MNKILENIKSGFVIGFTALFVMITGGVIYATLSNTWTEPEEVSTGNPLTAGLWNNTQSNIKNLGERVGGVENNLNTLSGTVASLQSSSNVPNVEGQVKFRNKYYKSGGDTKYIWTDAKTYCDNLGIGRRLSSNGDLEYIYDNKSSLSALSLQSSSYYWSDDLFYDSDGNSSRVLSMNNATVHTYPITYSYHVICIHD